MMFIEELNSTDQPFTKFNQHQLQFNDEQQLNEGFITPFLKGFQRFVDSEISINQSLTAVAVSDIFH